MFNIIKILPLVFALVVVSCGNDSLESESPKASADQTTTKSETDSAQAKAAVVRKPSQHQDLKVWFEPVLTRTGTAKVSTDFTPTPDGKAFFVLGRDGGLHHISQRFEDYPITAKPAVMKLPKPDVSTRQAVQISGTFADGDLGAMALALDPNYDENGFLYVWYANKDDSATLLDRFKWSPDQAAFDASRTNIITVSRNNPPAPYHAGGILKFLKDGTLLLSPGDAEQPELAQDPMNLNGKFLRIRPHTDADGGYDVPEDNPKFAGIEHRPEIVGMGLRAVFRGCLDQNENLIFGDVGSAREEVNVWTRGAENFGWGLFEFSDGPDNMPEGVVKPMVWWSKKEGFAKDDPDYVGETRLSAGVGLVYERPEKPEHDRYDGLLDDHLVFFDIMRGWIRSGPWNYDEHSLGEHQHIGHLSFISQMKQGKDGFVYVVTWGGTPTLFRMRPEWDSVAH